MVGLEQILEVWRTFFDLQTFFSPSSALAETDSSIGNCPSPVCNRNTNSLAGVGISPRNSFAEISFERELKCSSFRRNALR